MSMERWMNTKTIKALAGDIVMDALRSDARRQDMSAFELVQECGDELPEVVTLTVEQIMDDIKHEVILRLEFGMTD